MMKKVLMIGGTGTLSMPVSKLLAANPEIELYILNRGSKPLPFDNATSLIADINDFESAKSVLQGLEFDCVCNFILFDLKQAKENYELFNGRTKQFIFISTNVVLDHREEVQVSETSPGYGNRYSSYGQKKAECEQYFLKKYEYDSFPVTIVRPTQTYSEGRIPLSVKGKTYWGVVQRMIDGKEVIVHGEGQNIWPSTHADDFARFFAGLVCNPNAVGEIYQIMNPEPQTFDMIYQKLAKKLGVDYKPVYIPTDLLRKSRQYDLETANQGDKRWSNLFDVTKIKEINPGIEFEIDMDKGLDLFIEYMDSHPELKKPEPEFDKWCDKVIARYHKLEEDFTSEDF